MVSMVCVLALQAYTVSVLHTETTSTGVMQFLKNNVFKI